MIAIDTNVLLRFFQHDNDPAQSQRAQSFVRTHGPVFLSDLVVAEFVWTCRKTFKMDRSAIHARLAAIAESTEFVVADAVIFERSVSGYGAIASDFADWLIGLSNLAQGCEATATFDKGAIRTHGFRELDV